jgi:hypothetical protein
MASFEDDVTFLGDVVFTGITGLPTGYVDNDSVDTNAAIARSKLATDALMEIDLGLEGWRDADTMQPLAATASGADLGFYPGTYGTDAPLLRTEDLKAAGSTTKRMRRQIGLPPEYVSAGNFRLRFFAGMVTTVANTSCDIDCEVREITGAGVGADICSTSVMTMNSLTFANKDFVMDTSGAVAGKSYDVRVTITCNDGATATAVVAAIAKTKMVLSIKG